MSSDNDEIGRDLMVDGIGTNVHDVGQGPPVLLLHGSGPGVSAWSNWRTVLPELARKRRVVAPDLVGFGYTERPGHFVYGLDAWVTHAIRVLDALDLARVDVIGNSFGGALALAMAIRYPKRIRRLVLMGSVGVPFALTQGLDAVWGYQPSLVNMRALMNWFAQDRCRVTDDLVRMRYEASIRPGVQDSFSAMFPAPRQRWVDALCSPESEVRALRHEALVIHGREDRVIPLSNAHTLLDRIPNAQLHVFGNCGHWTQIEQAARFTRVVEDFLDERNFH